MRLPQEIPTARLYLRPYRLSDGDDVFKYAADEEWGRFMPVPHPYAQVDAESFVARQVLLDRTVHAAWALELDGVVVGGVDLRFDMDHARGEIGWATARWLWGMGYASEAASAVVDAAFAALDDLNKISASANSNNHASVRVMQKIGMTQEGLFRKQRRWGDGYADEVWFAILRSEWGALGAGEGR